ncbi:MAG TPA: hypothetical protein VFV70_08455 [Hyphomonadaceae bacterium]|nr:hypothetical protein [Hyphomonadaceae bacterium]
MKSILLTVGASLVLVAACATTPPKPKTPAELLLGTWTCETRTSAVAITANMTYSADGKETGEMSVGSAGNPTMMFAATGKVDGSWKLIENDTKLQQTLANVTITSAKLNDQVIEPAMAQSMIGPSLAGQSSVTDMKIDDKTLTLTDSSGTITSCTR